MTDTDIIRGLPQSSALAAADESEITLATVPPAPAPLPLRSAYFPATDSADDDADSSRTGVRGGSEDQQQNQLQIRVQPSDWELDPEPQPAPMPEQPASHDHDAQFRRRPSTPRMRRDKLDFGLDGIHFPTTRLALWDRQRILGDHGGRLCPDSIAPPLILSVKMVRDLVAELLGDGGAGSRRELLVRAKLELSREVCGDDLRIHRVRTPYCLVLDGFDGRGPLKFPLNGLTSTAEAALCSDLGSSWPSLRSSMCAPSAGWAPTTEGYVKAVSRASSSALTFDHLPIHLSACAYDSSDLYGDDGRPMLALTARLALPALSVTLSGIRPLPMLETKITDMLFERDWHGRMGVGLITLNQARRAVFLSEDLGSVAPPLVGLWVAGVHDLHHPIIWSSCISYVLSHRPEQQISPDDGSTTFIVAIVAPGAKMHNVKFYEASIERLEHVDKSAEQPVMDRTSVPMAHLDFSTRVDLNLGLSSLLPADPAVIGRFRVSAAHEQLAPLTQPTLPRVATPREKSPCDLPLRKPSDEPRVLLTRSELASLDPTARRIFLEQQKLLVALQAQVAQLQKGVASSREMAASAMRASMSSAASTPTTARSLDSGSVIIEGRCAHAEALELGSEPGRVEAETNTSHVWRNVAEAAPTPWGHEPGFQEGDGGPDQARKLEEVSEAPAYEGDGSAALDIKRDLRPPSIFTVGAPRSQWAVSADDDPVLLRSAQLLDSVPNIIFNTERQEPDDALPVGVRPGDAESASLAFEDGDTIIGIEEKYLNSSSAAS